jgi:hypothetical protein
MRPCLPEKPGGMLSREADRQIAGLCDHAPPRNTPRAIRPPREIGAAVLWRIGIIIAPCVEAVFPDIAMEVVDAESIWWESARAARRPTEDPERTLAVRASVKEYTLSKPASFSKKSRNASASCFA